MSDRNLFVNKRGCIGITAGDVRPGGTVALISGITKPVLEQRYEDVKRELMETRYIQFKPAPSVPSAQPLLQAGRTGFVSIHPAELCKSTSSVVMSRPYWTAGDGIKAVKMSLYATIRRATTVNRLALYKTRQRYLSLSSNDVTERLHSNSNRNRETDVGF